MTQSRFDAIKQAHLSQEKPIIEGFLSWLERQNPVKGSRLDEAVTYIRNRKEHLAVYLGDGRCSFSNNLSFCTIKRKDAVSSRVIPEVRHEE